MNLIVKIAWRNIMRHKGKSIIIGVILFLGAFLMTIGNGVISGMDRGLEKNIVNSFTGDIVLVSEKQETDDVFIGFMGKAVEPINNFLEVKKVLNEQAYIDNYVPVGKNMVMVLNEEGGMPANTFVLGADVKKYTEVFPNTMVPIEGRLMISEERGIVVPIDARKEMFDYTNIWFKPENETLVTANVPKENGVIPGYIVYKDSVVLMGFNNENTTTDIRLGIKGVVKYKALNKILGHFALMDIESYRTCLGYFSAEDKAVELSNEEQSLLGLDGENLDAMFSDNTQEENLPDLDKAVITEIASTGASVAPEIKDIDAGAYNLVLLKLKDGEKLSSSVSKLNKILKEEKLQVRAISWKKAMGMIGSTSVIIKGALFTFVMLLFFVAIIIIVNTLSMAAIERTSEIGMMRAVGARKGFIQKMFLGETAMLSFVFGGTGIVAGIILVKIISILHITSDNDMIQLLYGGDKFNPLLSMPDIGLAVIQLALVTLIAVVYPIKVASNITPLDAISRE